MSDLSEIGRKKLKEMFDEVDSIDLDDIKTKGFTIRSGNQLVKLSVAEVEEITVEQEIREELKMVLREKLQEIKVRLNEKVQSIISMTDNMKAEAARKEKELKDKLKRATPMPDVSWDEAKKGISVIRGSSDNEIVYLYRAVYWPKFVVRTSPGGDTIKRAIEPKYAKKMSSPIIITIRVRNNKIYEVATKKPINLRPFPHYHQQGNGDCWGYFRYESKVNNVNDIINVAKAAEAVLETVNLDSIATQNPNGLPRRTSLEKHLVKLDEVKVEYSQKQRRTGMNEQDDVWSSF